jgi:site-specific DNA-adenine methylase
MAQSLYRTDLKAPFPWFGGKTKAAPLIWSRLGDVPNYVEPFAGSLAVLLKRKGYDQLEHTETVNDKDCYLSNFWRALSSDPDAVTKYADHPVNEADLHARHLWLVNRAEFREQMLTDPDYYDAKIAGWWVWGLCQWIGSGWCKLNELEPLDIADVDLGNNGMGVHRQLPHLGDNGMGVHRKLPHLGDNGRGNEPCGSLMVATEQGVLASPAPSLGGQRYGCASQASDNLRVYFEALANRLRRVRVCCGDWTRVLGPSPTEKIGITGIVLDPPYDQTLRGDVYACESNVSEQVREWAIANGNNPKLRIALCGYSDEHAMPDSWECATWKAGGGYDGQNHDRDNNNRAKETIWFSPHCLKPAKREQLTLFGGAA